MDSLKEYALIGWNYFYDNAGFITIFLIILLVVFISLDKENRKAIVDFLENINI